MVELKGHNQRPFRMIAEDYKNGAHSVIYVSGVGTGKSFVFMAVAGSLFPGRILYVVPKHAITSNMKEYADFGSLAGRVDFVTYNQFTSIKEGLARIYGYGLVVIDECHHLGSDRYGRNLVRCMQESDIPFLGLTATPVRDDHVDVSQYFEKRVDGISNFEAIRQGLMPPIEYRVCYPEKSLSQLEREYDYTVRAKLSYEKSEPVLKDAVRVFQRDKWIVFFSSVEALRQHQALVKRLFPEYRVFILHSALNNLNEVVAGVQCSEKAVILSVNILLEGVHLPSIDGIILMRNVTSLTAFQQMIGRVCSIGKKVGPVVLDCSASSVRLMAKLFAVNRKMAQVAPEDGGGEVKEIIRIGIGTHKEYDINRFFRLCQEGRDILDAGRAEKVAAKYKSLGGKEYRVFEELKKDSLDYGKFRACCKMYDIGPEIAFRYVRAGKVNKI